ncbi:MAG: gamma-glutamyl-gamma-aminobutyrate hydrolase family protein [Pseudomonadota bacterium]|nr:gamma-glutamyl-gamma-aminobutyrate hydrolase family protein [Pseudomonadota bacterium]
MAPAVVDFVITEHPPAITPGLARDYEVIRRRIERLGGVPVRSRHYCDGGEFAAAALILSGSFAPWSLHDPDALARLGQRVERFDGAVLGICGGMQLQTIFAGGAVGPRERPAIGYGTVEVLEGADLLSGFGLTAETYEHHSCDVITLPDDFEVLARSQDCAVEAVRSLPRRWWGTQFHPERFSARRPDGARILRNFLALAGVG